MLDVIRKVYEQQKFMFDNKKHSVKNTTYKDNTDRIEVERKFNLAKRKFGIGLLYTKLKNTTEASILLSVIAMNIVT